MYVGIYMYISSFLKNPTKYIHISQSLSTRFTANPFDFTLCFFKTSSKKVCM